LSKVTVARTIPSFYPYATGPAHTALEISKRLAPSGYTSVVYTSDYQAQGSPKGEVIDSVTVHRLHTIFPIMQYCMAPGLDDALDSCNPSLVHAHGYRNFFTERAFEYAKRTRVPFLISAHGSVGGFRHMIRSRIKSIPYSLYDVTHGLGQLNDASGIIVHSSSEEAEIREFVPDAKAPIYRIPVGIDKRPRSVGSSSGQDILLVARFSEERDPSNIIKAMAEVVRDFPEARLSIVGGRVILSSVNREDVIAKSKRLVAQLKLQDHVSFLGELRGQKLREAFMSADIFVYSSVYENFGLPILEAAAYGLPIVAPPVGVVNDLLEDGGCGFMVNARENPDSLVKRLCQLLGSHELRTRLGDRVRQKVQSEFDWDRVTDTYAALYAELIRNAN
jgi:glycosyltransferase involved in cell wall biosynthesis